MNIQETSFFNQEKQFYRKMFYQCKDYLDNDNRHFCILTGPRKTGKTFCLNQIQNLYSNAIYFNFKIIQDENEQFDIISRILKDKSSTIYLLDEITYLNTFDIRFNLLAEKFTYKNRFSKVKIVITGSQAVSIRKFAMDAFATDACYIKTSFIDFEEWLLYRNKISNYNQSYNCIEEDYLDYIVNSSEFLNIRNNEEYLEACIHETINSNLKAYASCYLLTEINTKDAIYVTSFLYSVLLHLHNQVNYNTFISDFYNKLDTIKVFLENEQDISTVVDNIDIINNLTKLKNLNSRLLKDIILFLMECDLITVTNCSTHKTDDLQDWLFNNPSKKDIIVKDFFRDNNITIKYPLFYVNILKELSKQINISLSDLLNNQILGSIVECNIRGLYSYRDKINPKNLCIDYEYKDYNGNEVDIIDYDYNILIEISVSDKKQKELHFNDVPDNKQFKKIVTSKTKEDDLYIPYYKFILKLSRGNFIK